jgi:hypothetical protein
MTGTSMVDWSDVIGSQLRADFLATIVDGFGELAPIMFGIMGILLSVGLIRKIIKV